MNWKELIEEEKKKEYYSNLCDFLSEESKKYKIYPPKEKVFEAFKLTPFDKVKVVVLGMDPYHNPNQAMGLSFSVLGSILPPSLKNIYKEMESDLKINPPLTGDLSYLAEQGVLLLNSALTVRESSPGSHMKHWTPFTDAMIASLNQHKDNVVYILWGNFAKAKKSLITNPTSFVIESAHPSPFSCMKFFGTKPFSRANQFLIEKNISPIEWSV